MVKAKHLLQENESALALASLQEKLESAQKEKLLQEKESAHPCISAGKALISTKGKFKPAVWSWW